MDAKGSAQLWLDSDELRFAENGEFFKPYDALSDFLKFTYDNAEAMFFEWRKREVQPLTPEIALFSGSFKYHLTFKDDKIWKGNIAYTATFVKRNGDWKIINGHESTKPL